MSLHHTWSNFVKRCNSERFYDTRPTYRGCIVDDRFKKFQDFESWALKQIGCGQPKHHLDKDVLVKGNKVYGPDTCAFIPQEINQLLRRKVSKTGLPVGVYVDSKNKKRFMSTCSYFGKSIWVGIFDTPELAFAAYKKRKEEIIKEVAAKFQASIDPRVYAALMTYQVEITD